MSAFSDAITVGLSAISQAVGEVVTYAQGAVSVEITGAVQGRSTWDADKPQPGLKIRERSASWLLQLSKLVDGSTQLYPTKGDTLTTSDGRTFRALPNGPADPVYSPVDRAGRSWVRVNMKER